MSEASGTGRPGRYTRSTAGLIGSILVLVLVVLGIVVFRGAFRETPEYEPEPIDYLALVTSLQQTGYEPAYPARLPEGWFVKNAPFVPGDRPVFDLAITTADGRFAGVHEEDRDADELVEDLVGPGADEGDEVSIGGSVAPRWETFVDTDGDHAYAATVRGQTVLVYGSADAAELRELVGSLTTETLDPAR